MTLALTLKLPKSRLEQHIEPPNGSSFSNRPVHFLMRPAPESNRILLLWDGLRFELSCIHRLSPAA